AGFALHAYRPHDDVRRIALLEAVQHVADDGARRRGDDADDARQKWQRLLALFREETLGGELAPALFEQCHERADTGRFERLHDDLIFRRAGVTRHLARCDDLEPFLGLETEFLEHATPDHRLDLG